MRDAAAPPNVARALKKLLPESAAVALEPCLATLGDDLLGAVAVLLDAQLVRAVPELGVSSLALL